MGIFSRKKTEQKVEQPTEAKVAPKAASATVLPKKVNTVLVQPLLTEKATVMGAYLFKVHPAATKNEIRKAFQTKYGKLPRKVNVVNVMGKTKMRGRVAGKRSNWKKAMIYLTKGETVDLNQ
ncbi:MAG: 50S ribosomal protein L23 [Candidatus Kerfeldbacteria bacterium]|nr:50S ribosomal protein L23 [Candidatus Kerfeldbacteria bacterium]